jgi:uncharacterized iron-regulated membrane protein
MIKPLLLRFHRWITLVFALPLFAIILTGLILSFEPAVQMNSIRPQSVDAARVADLIRRYDPDGKARGVSINSAEHRITLQGTEPAEIDFESGEKISGQAVLPALFLWARRTHEHLLGQSWLVISSTIGMVVIMCVGLFMGLPRLRNSLSGWHKGTAWFTLPLIVLSPLTGLCLAFGWTFQASPPPLRSARLASLPEAVSIVARSHDLAQVTSIRSRGRLVMARIFEGGELRSYAVTGDDLVPLPRNWPRLIHEGNWSAMIASSLNIVNSLALLGLLSTGLLLWTRRQLRRPQGRRSETRRADSVGPAASSSVGG